MRQVLLYPHPAMSIDFQQISQQIIQWGEGAPTRARLLEGLRETAMQVLQACAHDLEGLRLKVERALKHDPSLRCALPAQEALDAHFPLPALPEQAALLAADGSQINPDRHGEVEFGLVNVGAIQMLHGSSQAPTTTVESRLLYDEALEDLSEATLALRRDLEERKMLAALAENAPRPAFALTDGPMELWGGGLSASEASPEFQRSLEEYGQALRRLHALQAVTAGYVDKPGARTLVRLLEVALTPEDELPQIKKSQPLRGVQDIDLCRRLLKPGERSAVFAIQFRDARQYPGPIALHFFYLNVGLRRPWLSRVEIPAWVAKETEKLDALHAVLVQQCSLTGERRFPYLLHRAHETAVVSFDERDQVASMIASELLRRGVQAQSGSEKQILKDLPGRTSYERRGSPKR